MALSGSAWSGGRQDQQGGGDPVVRQIAKPLLTTEGGLDAANTIRSALLNVCSRLLIANVPNELIKAASIAIWTELLWMKLWMPVEELKAINEDNIWDELKAASLILTVGVLRRAAEGDAVRAFIEVLKGEHGGLRTPSATAADNRSIFQKLRRTQASADEPEPEDQHNAPIANRQNNALGANQPNNQSTGDT